MHLHKNPVSTWYLADLMMDTNNIRISTDISEYGWIWKLFFKNHLDRK